MSESRSSQSFSVLETSLVDGDVDVALARALTGLSDNPDAQKYLLALSSAQKELGKLKAEVANLKALNAEMTLKAATKSRRKKTQGDESVVVLLPETISHQANYYQLFYSPTIKPSAFGIDRPQFRYNDLERYANEGNRVLGLTAELYDCIPVKYHVKGIKESPTFAAMFVDAVGSARSNALKRFRAAAGEIFGLNPEYFKREFPRSTIPEIRRLLGITVGKDGKNVYDPKPPVLFPEGKEHIQAKIFWNPVLFKLGRTTIYGPTYMDKSEDRKLVIRSNGTYSREDARSVEATAGLISWSGTMSQFMLSDDTEFPHTGIGNVTEINWFTRCEHYTRLLIEGLHTNPVVAKLFEKWNAEVCPSSKGAREIVTDSTIESQPGKGKAPDASESISAQLAQMKLSDLGDSDIDSDHEVFDNIDIIDRDTNRWIWDDAPGTLPESHSTAADTTTVTEATPTIETTSESTLTIGTTSESETSTRMSVQTTSVPTISMRPTISARPAISARRAISARPAISTRPAALGPDPLSTSISESATQPVILDPKPAAQPRPKPRPIGKRSGNTDEQIITPVQSSPIESDSVGNVPTSPENSLPISSPSPPPQPAPRRTSNRTKGNAASGAMEPVLPAPAKPTRGRGKKAQAL
ncbi:hypothetical protein BDZ97DRAFT_1753148 [Flammula alnicola]|nr:hypothetical protein BDZ97DRAFT_1753148 [Flammula alnicola]